MTVCVFGLHDWLLRFGFLAGMTSSSLLWLLGLHGAFVNYIFLLWFLWPALLPLLFDFICLHDWIFAFGLFDLYVCLFLWLPLLAWLDLSFGFLACMIISSYGFPCLHDCLSPWLYFLTARLAPFFGFFFACFLTFFAWKTVCCLPLLLCSRDCLLLWLLWIAWLSLLLAFWLLWVSVPMALCLAWLTLHVGWMATLNDCIALRLIVRLVEYQWWWVIWYTL